MFLNEIAKKRFGNSLIGKSITDHMSCKGKLQFEIAMKSKLLRPFTDSSCLISGYSHFYIVPGNISSCKLATVVLLHSEHDSFIPDYSPMSVELLSSIINSLISPEFNSSYEYDDGLFDAPKAVQRIKERLNNSSFLPNKTVFHDHCRHAEQHTYICDCPLYSFTSLLTALSYITDSLSSSGKADIYLSYSQDSFEVKITTETAVAAFASSYDAVVSLLPSCSITADICKFIAESNNCKLDANCNGNIATFTLSFNYPDLFADFKSNDPFKSFESMLDKIFYSITSIYKEEEQE